MPGVYAQVSSRAASGTLPERWINMKARVSIREDPLHLLTEFDQKHACNDGCGYECKVARVVDCVERGKC